MSEDIGADTLKISIHIGVGVAQDGNALFPEMGVPLCVGALSGEVIMLGAVQLDGKLALGNVEIHDIGADDLLAVYHDR